MMLLVRCRGLPHLGLYHQHVEQDCDETWNAVDNESDKVTILQDNCRVISNIHHCNVLQINPGEVLAQCVKS